MLDLSNERICITGGDGFLGRHLQERLRNAGARELLIPLIQDYDLTDQEQVARMYRDLSPTVVVHLAAEVGGIGANRSNPGRFFFANMAMGLHLIEQGRRRGLRKFLQVGTVCAYPKFTPVPFREDQLWEGYPEETNAPYGIAKKALLVMLQSYRQQYDFNGIYLLPVNLYGPGDNFDLQTSHVIPALIRKLLHAVKHNSPTVEVWGTGSASREFLYVDDAADALTAALKLYDGPEPVNVGAGFEIAIRDLVTRIAELTGFGGTVVWDTTKPDGQPRRCLDTSRAQKLFGFKAAVGFDEGLRRTIEWARNQPGLI